MNWLIVVIIALFMPIDLALGQCDAGMCDNVCHSFNMNGTCDSGACDCGFGQKCSDMEPVCDSVCQAFKLNGECDDNDQCVCKAELEICLPTECQEQCEEDPRAKECVFVLADACMEYGPVRVCSCICYQQKFQTVALQKYTKVNKYNQFKVVRGRKNSGLALKYKMWHYNHIN